MPHKIVRPVTCRPRPVVQPSLWLTFIRAPFQSHFILGLPVRKHPVNTLSAALFLISPRLENKRLFSPPDWPLVSFVFVQFKSQFHPLVSRFFFFLSFGSVEGGRNSVIFLERHCFVSTSPRFTYTQSHTRLPSSGSVGWLRLCRSRWDLRAKGADQPFLFFLVSNEKAHQLFGIQMLEIMPHHAANEVDKQPKSFNRWSRSALTINEWMPLSPRI